jgi:8-oxo-dGTP pyrophosphatase MutT (NUDIX family)
MPVEPWITLESELVFDHRWYKVRRDKLRLPNGEVLDDYFVSVRPEIVVVFAVTAEDEVLFVRQYRPGAGAITVELPGGTFDGEPGAEAAERELLEETGYRCGRMLPLCTVYADASKNTNQIHSFLGTEAVRVAGQDLDEVERASGGVDVLLIPVRELRDRIRSGEIKNESTVLAIYRALEELGV